MKGQEASPSGGQSRAWGRAGVQVGYRGKIPFSVHLYLQTSPCSGLQVSNTGREEPGEGAQDGTGPH